MRQEAEEKASAERAAAKRAAIEKAAAERADAHKAAEETPRLDWAALGRFRSAGDVLAVDGPSLLWLPQDTARGDEHAQGRRVARV